MEWQDLVMEPREEFLTVAEDRRLYLHIALSIMENAADAEDCVQNAMLKAWDRLGQWRGQGNMGGWVRTIVVNECLLMRRHMATLRESLITDDHRAPEPNPEQSCAQAELTRAIPRLPKRHREVMSLRFHGYSVPEAAAHLRISTMCYKDRLFQARMNLAARFNRHHGRVRS